MVVFKFFKVLITPVSGHVVRTSIHVPYIALFGGMFYIKFVTQGKHRIIPV